MKYEIKEHSAYIAIWEDGVRIAKVPIKNSIYGLMPNEALAMAQKIVDSLKVMDQQEVESAWRVRANDGDAGAMGYRWWRVE